MTIVRMVWKSLRQHVLSTVITSLSIALAGGLLLSVWTIQDQASKAFQNYNAGFDAVLGARGSKLQLVLNAIFHLEASPGNLKYQDFRDIRDHPSVALAIPLALGDNYRGYRLIGTTTNLFEDVEFADGRRLEVEVGRTFEDGFREAVVGSYVAQRLGLDYGDVFHPYHGLDFVESEAHEEEYVVTGVALPTNTPADRVIWIPLAGIQKMSGHDPKAANDLSAVLVKLKAPQAGFMLDMLYNKQGNRLTFAWPIGQVVGQLFSKINWFDRVLEIVAVLLAVVAGGSVLASIYNTMNERRRDIAILRALGAKRRVVFSWVVLEALAIAAIGAILSFAVYAVILSTTAAIIREQTGVILEASQGNPAFLWTPIGLLGVGALAGLLPALKAYTTDVASHLVPVS